MTAGRPLIGITAAIESARWAVWEDVEANICQRSYSLAVAEAGAIAMLAPADESVADAPQDLIGRLDALLLSGGADIDPAAYGAEAEPGTSGFRGERDRFELALARAALDRGLPVLGICRGMEILNVACGGTLEQHLADSDLHLHTPGRFSDHEVVLEPGSLAARAVGRERVAVRSHHHQGIGRLGEGLVVSGWAEPGGVIEAIESSRGGFALGVLWHAEEIRPSPVIAALAEAAREKMVVA